MKNNELKDKVIDKKCACGLLWVRLPENARYHNSNDIFAGIYFECSCRSTLVLLDYYDLKLKEGKIVA